MSACINIDAQTRQMIHNYNNKVYRLRRKGQDIDYLRLSDFAKLDEAAQQNKLRYTEAFRRKGSEQMTEYGVKQYEVDYAKSLLDQINKVREERRALMKPSPYKGNLAIVARANLEPRKMDLTSPDKFGKMLKSLEEEAAPDFWRKTDEAYKEGYFTVARENLGPEAEAQLRELLKDVPADQFYLMGVDNPEIYIDEEYIANKNNASDAAEKTQTLIKSWSNLLNGEPAEELPNEIGGM